MKKVLHAGTCMELYLHCPKTPSWRGAQLKRKDIFTFPLLVRTACNKTRRSSGTFRMSARGVLSRPSHREKESNFIL